MTLACAIIWTVCLVLDIIDAAIGGSPSWILVFCPLIVLVWRYWQDYIENDF
jgi:hypothetical protein